jgi:hypothetical protein
MPQLAIHPESRPPFGLYQDFERHDESITARTSALGVRFDFRESAFWSNEVRFSDAWKRLRNTTTLADGWDTYQAEAPNAIAHDLAQRVLTTLEGAWLAPARVLPSAEGGIAISFVAGDRRAEIEVYNTGEVVAATYSSRGEPAVWELRDTEDALKTAIASIRVHLAD